MQICSEEDASHFMFQNVQGNCYYNDIRGALAGNTKVGRYQLCFLIDETAVMDAKFGKAEYLVTND